ncbi:MAG: ATP-dependent DNA helicase [Thermoplasmatota archaeon]
MAELALFPYEPRAHQQDIVAAMRRSLAAAAHLVVESGTGTGKTVCALAAALAEARSRGKRVLYLSRTNAQARQVVLEYRRIRARDPSLGASVALQGRQHLCPLAVEDDEVGRASAEELGLMCRDRCHAAEQKAAGERPRVTPCRFYERSRAGGLDALVEWARADAPTAEELAEEAARAGKCGYFLTRELLPTATLIAAPYVYFFEPGLRRALLEWAGASLDDLIVVVDEAHNLPDFARSLGSAELKRRTLAMAAREAEEFGNIAVLEGFTLVSFMEALGVLLERLAGEYVGAEEEDALVPPEELDAHLLSTFRVATPRLDRALAVLDDYGDNVRQQRRRAGRVPRSHVGAVAAFLRFYRSADEETHVRLVRRDGEDPVLECFALDPSLVTLPLLATAGSVHMSGTLAPLDEYRTSIGLPRDTPTRSFPSPFPRANRLALFDPDVTTRYEDVAREPHRWDEIRARLAEVRAATDRNMAVFVPSYESLARVAKVLDGRAAVVREVQGASQQDLMRAVETFKATRGATLLSVIGGRLFEGLDFPDEELEVVVIVGLPYPKPTARVRALERFYDRKFGDGFAFAVEAPMTRRALQAAGRLIRRPTDRGVLVFLDRRAALLRSHVPDLAASRDIAGDMARFFS